MSDIIVVCSHAHGVSSMSTITTSLRLIKDPQKDRFRPLSVVSTRVVGPPDFYQKGEQSRRLLVVRNLDGWIIL